MTQLLVQHKGRVAVSPGARGKGKADQSEHRAPRATLASRTGMDGSHGPQGGSPCRNQCSREKRADVLVEPGVHRAGRCTLGDAGSGPFPQALPQGSPGPPQGTSEKTPLCYWQRQRKQSQLKKRRSLVGSVSGEPPIRSPVSRADQSLANLRGRKFPAPAILSLLRGETGKTRGSRSPGAGVTEVTVRCGYSLPTSH